MRLAVGLNEPKKTQTHSPRDLAVNLGGRLDEGRPWIWLRVFFLCAVSSMPRVSRLLFLFIFFFFLLLQVIFLLVAIFSLYVRCQYLSGGQKISPFCTHRIEVILFHPSFPSLHLSSLSPHRRLATKTTMSSTADDEPATSPQTSYNR